MTELQPEVPSVISALRWQFLARQGRGWNAKCSFHLLQILAAMLLLLSHKDVNDESIEKLVFVKQLCEAEKQERAVLWHEKWLHQQSKLPWEVHFCTENSSGWNKLVHEAFGSAGMTKVRAGKAAGWAGRGEVLNQAESEASGVTGSLEREKK